MEWHLRPAQWFVSDRKDFMGLYPRNNLIVRLSRNLTFLLTNAFPFFNVLFERSQRVAEMAKESYVSTSKYCGFYFFIYFSVRGPD